MHQVILNILVTKYISNKVFDFIYTWNETLASIPWAIRSSYQFNIQATPGQSVFGRDVIFNLASVVYWKFITSRNSDKWALIMSEKIIGDSHIPTPSLI